MSIFSICGSLKLQTLAMEQNITAVILKKFFYSHLHSSWVGGIKIRLKKNHHLFIVTIQ